MQVLISSHMAAEQDEHAQRCQRHVRAQQCEWLDRRPVSGGFAGEAAQLATDRLRKFEDAMLQIHEASRRFAERTEGGLAVLVSEGVEEFGHSFLGGAFLCRVLAWLGRGKHEGDGNLGK